MDDTAVRADVWIPAGGIVQQPRSPPEEHAAPAASEVFSKDIHARLRMTEMNEELAVLRKQLDDERSQADKLRRRMAKTSQTAASLRSTLSHKKKKKARAKAKRTKQELLEAHQTAEMELAAAVAVAAAEKATASRSRLAKSASMPASSSGRSFEPVLGERRARRRGRPKTALALPPPLPYSPPVRVAFGGAFEKRNGRNTMPPGKAVRPRSAPRARRPARSRASKSRAGGAGAAAALAIRSVAAGETSLNEHEEAGANLPPNSEAKPIAPSTPILRLGLGNAGPGAGAGAAGAEPAGSHAGMGGGSGATQKHAEKGRFGQGALLLGVDYTRGVLQEGGPGDRIGSTQQREHGDPLEWNASELSTDGGLLEEMLGVKSPSRMLLRRPHGHTTDEEKGSPYESTDLAAWHSEQQKKLGPPRPRGQQPLGQLGQVGHIADPQPPGRQLTPYPFGVKAALLKEERGGHQADGQTVQPVQQHGSGVRPETALLERETMSAPLLSPSMLQCRSGFARLLLHAVTKGLAAAPIVLPPSSVRTCPRQLRVVDISSCRVGNVGIHLLGSFLVTHLRKTPAAEGRPELMLCLRDNEISDEGALILSRLLGQTGSIVGLDLRDNNIGPPGAQALAQAVNARGTHLRGHPPRRRGGDEPPFPAVSTLLLAGNLVTREFMLVELGLFLSNPTGAPAVAAVDIDQGAVWDTRTTAGQSRYPDAVELLQYATDAGGGELGAE